MSDITDILPSYLPQASQEEKKAFFQALVCVARVDGHEDSSELQFISNAAADYGVDYSSAINDYPSEEEVIENVKIIKDRHLALELIREMCILSHIDNILSSAESLLICRIGLAMGIEAEKIEQISNWIIDRIIWFEQAGIIFEENNS
jgi:hypothetical protein